MKLFLPFIKPMGISLSRENRAFITRSAEMLYFASLYGSTFIVMALLYPPKTSTLPISLILKRYGFIKLSAIFLISPKVIDLFLGLKETTSTGRVKLPTV